MKGAAFPFSGPFFPGRVSALLLPALLLFFASCGPGEREPSGAVPPGSSSRVSDPEKRAGGEGTFLGTVEEVFHSGGYTYARVRKGGRDVWVAGPETALKKGERLAFLRGAPLEDFHSKTLGRTFKKLYFVSRFRKVGGKSATVGDRGREGKRKGPGVRAKEKPGRVYTVALLWKKKAGLGGKVVRVRGVVTKVNAGIMGKNWIHLADAGAPKGARDLVFTTKDRVEEGEKVLVRGKVGLNRDFGYGYRYEMILEEGFVEARER